MKAKLLKAWRAEVQTLIAQAAARADFRGLEDPEREKFIRRVPRHVKHSRLMLQVWYSEIRRRVPSPVGRLPLTFE